MRLKKSDSYTKLNLDAEYVFGVGVFFSFLVNLLNGEFLPIFIEGSPCIGRKYSLGYIIPVEKT
jgi:hypothetical protein